MKKTLDILEKAFGSLAFWRVCTALGFLCALLGVWSIGRYGPDYLSVVLSLLGAVDAVLAHIACEEATFYEGIDFAGGEA